MKYKYSITLIKGKKKKVDILVSCQTLAGGLTGIAAGTNPTDSTFNFNSQFYYSNSILDVASITSGSWYKSN